MKKITFKSSGTDLENIAFPVLIKEAEMRRASEHYINHVMEQDDEAQDYGGRYITEYGKAEFGADNDSKIFVLNRMAENEVVVEKAYFYHPWYLD